jgi:hypothetical protein
MSMSIRFQPQTMALLPKPSLAGGHYRDMQYSIPADKQSASHSEQVPSLARLLEGARQTAPATDVERLHKRGSTNSLVLSRLKNDLPAPSSPTFNPAIASYQSTVFDGQAAFPNTQAAFRWGLDEVYQIMAQEDGAREYGFEVVPTGDGKLELGRLVRGDGGQVRPFSSDEGWLARIFGGATLMPFAHSHPSASRAPHFSGDDLSALLEVRTLGGTRSAALLDYNSGTVYGLNFDPRVEVPPTVLASLRGRGGEVQAAATRDWVAAQLDTGALQVHDLGRVRGAPSDTGADGYFYLLTPDGNGDWYTLLVQPQPAD